jgi:phosphatidylethanolamine/phosphatidyl-N-methylethanolamine N-methyltransferase
MPIMDGTRTDTQSGGFRQGKIMGNALVEDNAAFWDRFSPRYDRFMARAGRVYDRFVERLDADLGDATRVLEVATGTGILALRLARSTRHVDAVDLAPGMLEQARRKAADAQTTGVEFFQASAYRLPFDDGSFDGAVCANALHVMEHPQRALAEIRRVCRPGAILVAPTFCHGQTLRARLVSRLMSLSGFRVYTRYTRRALAEQVMAAGFTIVADDLLAGLFPLVYLTARTRA